MQLQASPELPEKDVSSPVRLSPSAAKDVPCEAKVVLPVLEFKEGTRSSWKFSREAPRLSLDSRAMVDAKGTLHPREIRSQTTKNFSSENDGDKQRRSTSSVIVRLMGLEPIPDSVAKLQRSASESRVSRDLPQCRFSESKSKSNNFPLQPNTQRGNVQKQNNANSNVNVNGINNRVWNNRAAAEGARTPLPLKQQKTIAQKKSFYDSTDFFPEPKDTVSIYGMIEKRLRMRGINQPSEDLHTLKHILEALQLKGLLHSDKPNQSPIVLMKPLRPSSPSFNRTWNDSTPPPSTTRSSPRAHRTLSSNFSGDNDRSLRSQAKTRNSSPNRRKVLDVETQRRVSNEGVDSKRVSPIHSPKISARKNATGQTATGGSPRTRRTIDHKMKVLGGAEDELSTVSENSFTTSSHTDTEVRVSICFTDHHLLL